MFKYKTDICEYIRLNTNIVAKQDEELAFKRYLDNHSLVLINKKTLSIVNTLEEVDALQKALGSEEYCQYSYCIAKSDMVCINCLLDYMLSIDYLKLVKKGS